MSAAFPLFPPTQQLQSRSADAPTEVYKSRYGANSMTLLKGSAWYQDKDATIWPQSSYHTSFMTKPRPSGRITCHRRIF